MMYMELLNLPSQSDDWNLAKAFVVDYNTKEGTEDNIRKDLTPSEHYDMAVAMNIGLCMYLYDYTPGIARIFRNNNLIDDKFEERAGAGAGAGAGTGSDAGSDADSDADYKSRIWCYEKATRFLAKDILLDELDSVKQATWQILYTICCLSDLRFVHNDLHVGNIGCAFRQETDQPAVTICLYDDAKKKPVYVSFSDRWYLIDFDQSEVETKTRRVNLRKEETCSFLLKLHAACRLKRRLKKWVRALGDFFGVPDFQTHPGWAHVGGEPHRFDNTKHALLKDMPDPTVRLLEVLYKDLFKSDSIQVRTEGEYVNVQTVFPRKMSYLKQASTFDPEDLPKSTKATDILKQMSKNKTQMLYMTPVQTITQAVAAYSHVCRAVDERALAAPLREYCPFMRKHFGDLVAHMTYDTIGSKGLGDGANPNFGDFSLSFKDSVEASKKPWPLPAVMAFLQVVLRYGEKEKAEKAEKAEFQLIRCMLVDIALASDSYKEFVHTASSPAMAGAMHVFKGVLSFARRLQALPSKSALMANTLVDIDKVEVGDELLYTIRSGFWRLVAGTAAAAAAE
jgi:hypothetical protein